jgi:acyl-coenzyme A thioesterase PaaI-like protein
VCFTRTELSCASGKRVADALATLRLRGAHGPAERRLVAARDVDPEPAPPAREIRAPFFSLMGLEVRGMAEGQSRIVLPWRPEIADGPGLHDGALLALLDAAGAMSSHAAHGAPAARNATIALQAQVFSPELPAADLLALGRCSLRDGDLFWNEIEIARHSTRELLARGSVVYHIV